MHGVKEFGVTRKEDFYSVLVSQGSWTKCLRCQSLFGRIPRSAQEGTRSAQEGTRPAQDASQRSCESCIEKFSGIEVPPGQHGCSVCKKFFSESHWKADVCRNHRRYKRDLVCHDCSEKGFTARHLKKYTCGVCSSIWGHKKYDGKRLDNHNNRGDLLRC